MKKFTIISLICVYALATMGFTLKEFYCCGKFQSVSLSLAASENNKCEKGSNDNDRCCKNKFQYFKVKDNHVISAQLSLPINLFAGLHLYNPSLQNIIFFPQKNTVAYSSNAPPLHYGVPDYIFNCVFRI